MEATPGMALLRKPKPYPVTFKEVAQYFTDPSQRAQYREAMQESPGNDSSLGDGVVSGMRDSTAQTDPDIKTCLEDISQHHEPANIHQSSREKGQEEVQGGPGRETPGTRRELLFPHSLHSRDRPIPHPTSEKTFQRRGSQHPCSVCGKSFGVFSNLLRHQWSHGGDKAYKCPECGKGFGHSSALVTHRRIHTGEKPYQCADCGKSFNVVSNLVRHQRSHTGETPYLCGVCGKSFAVVSNLARHRRVHTGEKPFRCGECGRQYSQRAHLTTHQRVHTGERPYVCGDCGKGFNVNSSLTKHRRGPACNSKVPMKDPRRCLLRRSASVTNPLQRTLMEMFISLFAFTDMRLVGGGSWLSSPEMYLLQDPFLNQLLNPVGARFHRPT
ncbi:PREDICTED: zinc finger protein 436-like [Fulmarus glacialis]|uniref:zinc finger protein 436-like n=1 Tax=Fulmarus glacialis TaxID=30455 RepID=UPI00051BCA2B|nr:PREDICTED: zinc finger protein 436-like [Fulmarus glacialis]